jgi:hypothetical protein
LVVDEVKSDASDLWSVGSWSLLKIIWG